MHDFNPIRTIYSTYLSLIFGEFNNMEFQKYIVMLSL